MLRSLQPQKEVRKNLKELICELCEKKVMTRFKVDNQMICIDCYNSLPSPKDVEIEKPDYIQFEGQIARLGKVRRIIEIPKVLRKAVYLNSDYTIQLVRRKEAAEK